MTFKSLSVTVRTRSVIVKTPDVIHGTRDVTVRTRSVTVKTPNVIHGTRDVTVRTCSVTVKTPDVIHGTCGVTVRTRDVTDKKASLSNKLNDLNYKRGKSRISLPERDSGTGGTLAKARTIPPARPKLCQECRPRAPIFDRVVGTTRKILHGCPPRVYSFIIKFYEQRKKE